MFRASRRLKEKQPDQKPRWKYTSEIYLAKLSTDDYESMAEYIHARLTKTFDDKEVNIMYREVRVERFP